MRAFANRVLALSLIATATALAATAPGSASPADPAARGGPYCPRGDEDGFKAKRLVGKRVPSARRTARRHDCSLRVTKRNGKNLIVTADYSPQRINVAVRDRRVVGIRGIG